MIARPRRILFVINALELDAPSNITAHLAAEAHRYGYKAEVAACSRSGPLGEWLEQRGVTSQVLYGNPIRQMVRLAALIKSRQPDVLCAALVRPIITAAIARPFSHTSCLFAAVNHSLYDMAEKGRLAESAMRAIFPSIINTADVILSVSEAAQDPLLQMGIDPNKLAVTPNGVDTRTYYPRGGAGRPSLAEKWFPNDDPQDLTIIGTAGNLRWVKGFDLLIETAAILQNERPNLRWVIFGEGPKRTALEKQIGGYGLRNIVALPGHSDNLREVFAGLDLYVQPSRSESFGLACAEAMASGLPVVVSPVGGLPGLTGNAGIVANSGSPADLAIAIGHLLDNPRLQEKYATAGRLRILENFSLEMMTRRFYAAMDAAVVRSNR